MAKKTTIGLTAKKEEFSEWYPQIIVKGDLADYSPVSGCIIFKPRSYAIWENIKKEVDTRFKKLNIKNCYFPLLIPETLLKKEATHVEGFAPEVAWVDYGGNSKLGERLAIRPTSETIMYEAYSRWIRSWRDLPLRLNQWNNVIRWEFKHPVPLLRTREFLWNEGHTAFATEEEAEQEVPEIITAYQDVVENYLALPGIIGRKTEQEKFAGAEYTISMEYVLPTGKGIQGPDCHHDGQLFSKAFDIQFLNKEEKKEYAWQNTFAISTRMLGVMLAIHSDDKGVILPPKIAPEHAVIIPIFNEKNKKTILKKAKEIQKQLESFKIHIDDRETYTPGWKFHAWELQGVPTRIELGPQDIEKEQVIIVRRDTGEKKAVKITSLAKNMEKILKDIQDNLFSKAKKFLEQSIVTATTKQELEQAIKEKKIVKGSWCGKESCEKNIKETGAKILNLPLQDINKSIEPQQSKKACIYCGETGHYLALIGKSY
jgi:prolyl-tRNA synthetase